ncbi:alpha/beta fold hydrolase [Corynebacterium phocae]|nr:alpha/beta hydrolase [Corynebacterium phocae]
MTPLHTRNREPGLTQLDVEDKKDGIAYFESGPADAQVTVVFFHGYGLSSESFYDQVKFLRKEFPQVRALLVDVRGHGLSDQVPIDQYTVDGAAEDVLKIVAHRAQSGKLLLVGHSLGGMVVQSFIRCAPQDVYDRIDGVLLISSAMQAFAHGGLASFLRSGVARWLFNSAQRLPGKVNRIRWNVARVVAPAFAALLTGFPQMERLQFHVDMILDTPVTAFAGFFDDLVHHDEFLSALRLKKLRGVIMVGSMDIVTPFWQSEIIQKHWPKAELHVVERAGHMVILEEPQEVSAALGGLLRDVVAED